MNLPENLPPNFVSKTDFSSPNGCWLWKGSLNANGYGRFRFGGSDSNGGKVWYAHLFSFIVHRRVSTEGFAIDHLCGVRNCVNPDHLDLVTAAENSRRARQQSGKDSIEPVALPKELPQSFLDKVQMTSGDDCWLWQGSKNAKGYGRYRFGGRDSEGGRVWYAHTFCYRVTSGDHSEDGVIDHLCNQRDCVNPQHLEKVSQQENLRRIYGRIDGPKLH